MRAAFCPLAATPVAAPVAGLVAALLAAALLAGCATAPAGLPPVQVAAVAETDPVGTAAQDAADDPAIWRNPANPAASLIVATDKKAGLYVYDLEGRTRSFSAGGLLNNVDLVDMGAQGVIVVASDRADPLAARLQVYRLDTGSATLVPLGSVPGGEGEGYGLCLHRAGDGLLAYSVLKEGAIHESRLTLGQSSGQSPGQSPGQTVSAEPLRQMKLATQTEGCVVDPLDGTLYVGEEGAGIWRFAPGSAEGQLAAPVDNRTLVADVEGLALLREGKSGWLVASSQGDNAYALFSLPDFTPLGRFTIRADRFGSVEETDGIALAPGSFGAPFPDGLFVAQDGQNAPAAQNFKLVSWAAVKAALGIE